ncbi:MAG: GNAT family N-acetyltransferase [Cellulosilyticaceae bacterium]
MKSLETQRCLLREWQLEDLEDVYAYSKNPNVGPNAGWKPHESREETKEIIERFQKQDDTWAIVEKATGKVIGSVGLHRDEKRDTPRVRMIGYALSQDYWGQGIMVEVVRRVIAYGFDEMQLKLISSGHGAFNVRSKRVLEKCGFKFEGIIRCGYVNYDGGIFDEFSYSITNKEYEDL